TTRASSPGSRGGTTGRRSCWITRATTSSSRSNMLRLSQILLQLLAGPLDPHLERRNAGAGQLRDLLVLEVLDVLEQERLAVLRVEPRQRAIDGIAPLQAIGVITAGVGRAIQRIHIMHEHPAAPGRARAGRATTVDEDAVQPGAEARRIAARQRAVGAYERVLQRFFRVFTVPDHMHGVAPQAIAIASNQHAVGADVAGPDPAHQLCVA